MIITELNKNPKTKWLEKILSERFGHEWNIIQKKESLKLQLKGAEGAIIFDRLQDCFEQFDSNFPCYNWNAKNESFLFTIESLLPAPSNEPLPKPLIEKLDENFIIHYDILGLTYWMLNRLEEINSYKFDMHQRFPATASHAFKHNYLNRPIIDEWFDILAQVIKKLWPSIRLKQSYFNIELSHDVDDPSLYTLKKNYYHYIKPVIIDLINFNIKDLFCLPLIYLNFTNKLSKYDPHNTFDWIMDLSEKNNITSTFNFICGGNSRFDPNYNIHDLKIKSLIKKINKRNHLIGLHPSYDSYNQPKFIKKQAKDLLNLLDEEKIYQIELSSRMHYLRWKSPDTLVFLDQAGINKDTTLGFADYAGYRCGSCKSFTGFDAINQQELKIKVQPLIAMECSLFNYMNLSHRETYEHMINLKEKCKKVKGTFSLLWHNSYLRSSELKDTYLKIIN
jgi:hypothetical protein